MRLTNSWSTNYHNDIMAFQASIPYLKSWGWVYNSPKMNSNSCLNKTISQYRNKHGYLHPNRDNIERRYPGCGFAVN